MSDIIKGDLHFIPNGNTFVCRELTEFPKRFEEAYTQENINQACSSLIDFMRDNIEIRYPSKEERDAVPVEERLSKGGKIFEEIVQTIDVTGMGRLQKFLFWLGYWWYYNPLIREKCTGGKNFNKHHEMSNELLAKYILPILPDQIRTQMGSMVPCSSATNFGHFAIMFRDSENDVRRIITDTQLIEIHDANGYVYLDVDQHGNPIARFCTNHGGGRAFFDGSRLMAHSSFQTCAPKTVIFDSGYKVNSTNCTIINGSLYPLIDVDDTVAKTTGAFMGMCDFSNQQHVDSFVKAEDSATRLKVERDKVTLDDRTIKPLGIFQPSSVKLLDSGFCLYEWSHYHEIFAVQYDHIMVVDDNVNWLKQIKHTVGQEVDKLVVFHTENGNEALQEILQRQPEVVILDMHLTHEERFDGLFIANKLIENGYNGAILIASSYPDEQLQAMSKLIKGKVQAPGKNIDRVMKCLCSRY